MKKYSLYTLLLFFALAVNAQHTFIIPDGIPNKRLFEIFFCIGSYSNQHLEGQSNDANNDMGQFYRYFFGKNSIMDSEELEAVAAVFEKKLIPLMEFFCTNPSDGYDHEMMTYKNAADNCYCSSTKEKAAPVAVKAYPNPAMDQIYISGLEKKSYNLSLTNFSSGKKFFSQELTVKDDQKDFRISLEGYPRGYYIINLAHEKSEVSIVIIKE